MTPERWEQIRDLLHSTLQLKEEERPAYLDQHCLHDIALRQELDQLLAVEADVGSSFLEPIAVNQVATQAVSSSTGSVLTPGTKLGSYIVQELIGAGGMGEVYRARDGSLKRDVAIKVIPASFARDPDRLRRFQLEAQAAAALSHPNIVSIFHVGQQDACAYIVSELLEGETLRERLRRSAMRLRDCVDIAVAIARGLAAAHERGIAHRDLKPENIFVTKDGQVKILDFGLAKLLQARAATADGRSFPVGELTRPGLVLGTVGYMSPEQVRGKPADARTDIFALGCVLYEMLTGTRAFHKETSAETMNAILNEDPPVASQIASSTPPALQRVVNRCLEKSPERRFQSASDLAFALEALSDSGSGPSSGVVPNKSQLWPWVAAAVVVAALVAGWYFRRSSASRTSASQGALEVRALTESGKAYRAAVTPDGRYVAYVQREAGKDELWLLQVATERGVQLLPGSAHRIRSLHFSPDGNFLYFLRVLDDAKDPDTSGVFRIATLGGPATLLGSDARTGDYRPNSVTVSPDGKQVAYISRTSTESVIVSIDPDGSNRHVLARRPIKRGFWFIEWSPFPDKLAATAIGDADMGLVRVDLPSGSIRDLSVSGWGAVGQPAWSPDGSTIYVPAVPNGGSVFQIWAFDARTGAHKPLTSSVTSYLQLSLSATATGDLVANTEGAETTLWVTDRGKAHSIDSINGEGSDDAVWVDDRIVTSNITEMMVHDSDGSHATKLQSYSGIYRNLARCGPGQVAYWAADGKRQSHIARTDIVTGSTSALTEGTGDTNPTCSADGSTLVYLRCLQQGSGTGCLVTRKSLDSGRTVTLYELSIADAEASGPPVLSPDGTKVLFLTHPDSKKPYQWAMIIPIEGGAPTKVAMAISSEEAFSYQWSPDGKAILYIRHDEHGVENIWSAPLDGKPPRKITNFDSDRIFAYGVSPDNRLLISRGNRVRDVVLIKNVK